MTIYNTLHNVLILLCIYYFEEAAHNKIQKVQQHLFPQVKSNFPSVLSPVTPYPEATTGNRILLISSI